ncbi:calpain family cysteine protease (macronuclear) [Tetrahymena thermophila SB210]|uniref:Calpain family cysteine protease n=1 Tax=Tetrahymena thermophila (strain SB210) TaxID=312017 RepID=I7MGN1_TETTS|nr:calpain family cysteine protease [Tetrahymena thermophila SB210]EAR85345.1 calpain family cysteine protease [Tetrahymena thermophila SB210]|eukprot:XP_001033008.1 calpain family cysteine protease [Tetrahymena thermophila SB210]
MGNVCCTQSEIAKDAFVTNTLQPNEEQNIHNIASGDEQDIIINSRNDAINFYLSSFVQNDDQNMNQQNVIQVDSSTTEEGEVKISTIQIKQTLFLNNIKMDLDSIKAHYLISNQKYEDHNFLPNINSITANPDQFPISKKVNWKRIEQIISQAEVKVFQGKIEPDDIYQGQLGDCYFLSALSSLAEEPDLISRLFEIVEYNPRGYYIVWLNHDGFWKQVVIDDYFPCLNNLPAFSKSHDNEIWVMILEKAYANLFKSYHNISAGLPELAVSDLTGSPFEWIFTKNVEETWNFIFSKVEDEKVNTKVKYILNAGSNSDPKGGIEVKDNTGIISGHAYAVLDAKVVMSRDGQERILQLRNPWGKGEWQGAWSDKSDKWTPELKKECNLSNKNDGLFWMSIEDFCLKYSSISCNYVYVHNLYNAIKIDFMNQRNYAVINFKSVRNSNNGYIQYHQKDQKNFKNIDDNYDYSQVRMIIFRGTPNNIISYVGQVTSYARNGFIKVNLQNKGEYFAIVQVNWEQSLTRELAISSYTEKEIYFDDKNIQYTDELSFIDDCLAKIPPKKSGEEYVYKNDSQIFRYTNSSFGYFYYVYVNQSTTTTFQEHLTMSKLEHLEICPPYKDSYSFEVELKPQTQKVVKYKILPEGEGNYQYHFKFTNRFILSKEDLIERIIESQSNKKARKIKGVETQVYFYSMFHGDGLAFYYQNDTQHTYYEQLKLALTNLKSEDNLDFTQIVNIKIPPKSGKLLKFKEINEEYKASYKISYAAYFKD